ncbi:MAG: hypothetical protein V4672_03215 [Verrucomicrobiota bacterium]
MNTSPLTLLRDFDDRLSPMVVKELRHGLRTRMFTSVLTVIQLCMILIVGSGVLGVDMEVIGNLFWGFALAALLVALPLRGFGTLSGEFGSGTMDMLTLTSIPSLRIVFGKWSALFSQSLLLGVSLLPYMVARYHFGGVEIFQEGIALLVTLLASGLATAAFVAFSSQRAVILRLFLGVGLLFSLIPVPAFVFVMINESGGDRALSEFLALRMWEQVGIVGGLLLVPCYGVYALLALGASRIAPISENHSTGKRLIHLVVLGLLAAVGTGLCFHPDDEAFLWVYVPSVVLTFVVGVDVLTEEMPRFPSVVQGLVRWGKPGRLLYPGWASGVWFYSLLGALNLGMLTLYAFQRSGSDLEESFLWVAGMLLSAVVPVCLRINKSNRFANWWVVNIGLGVAGVLLSIFVNISDAKEGSFLGCITPVTGLFASTNNYQLEDEILVTTALGGLGWLVAALVLVSRENKVYALLETEAQELDDRSKSS